MKLLIVGLDGGTFNVIEPMREAGELPNLGRILDGGASGLLESTVPPLTAPAWASFFTGKNPGKHGVFDFVWQLSPDEQRSLVNSNSIQGETIWEILSSAGNKVGLLDVPMTYPPRPVNGFVVAGLLTPSAESLFTYPTTLHTELISGIGEYVIEHDLLEIRKNESEIDFLKSLFKVARNRRDAALYLMKRHRPDVFSVVFSLTDRLQHFYWKLQGNDAGDARSRKLRNLIYQGYKQVDEYLGDILDACDGETPVLLLSDHGFGAISRYFYVNRWLRQEGLLSLRNDLTGPTRTAKVKKSLAEIAAAGGMTGMMRFLPGAVQRMGFSVTDQTPVPIPEQIDWASTKAYSAIASTDKSIFINLKGREPSGIVKDSEYEDLRNELIRRLEKIADPDGSGNLISKAHKREDLYHGPAVQNAPDLHFLFRNEEYIVNQDFWGEELTGPIPEQVGTGFHRPMGFYAIRAPGIREGTRFDQARMIDLAPTILYMMNQPVPNDMDGRVLEQVFDARAFQSRPPQTGVSHEREKPTENVYSEEEEEAIKRRLQDLGYFG